MHKKDAEELSAERGWFVYFSLCVAGLILPDPPHSGEVQNRNCEVSGKRKHARGSPSCASVLSLTINGKVAVVAAV